MQLLIDGERDKAARTRYGPRYGIERPAAAQISAQVWLLDRSDVAPAAPQRAREQVWQGWNFEQGGAWRSA